ncbi:MAG TPA: presenilin family intramembrane aspartyl protease [Candidatus Methanofastidiosa archaeon]|nr:presenilin family intramembrane aspartyl protease [Candidatus Methanofastidiosa archaeon]
MFEFVKADAKVVSYLIGVQLLALGIARNLISQDVELVEGGAGVETSVLFFLLILAATLLLLVIIKMRLSRYLYIFTDYFGLFFITLYMVSSVTDNPLMGLLASSVAIIMKIFLGKNKIVGLAASATICIGIASIIGITFGPPSLIILLLLLSAYDFIAVKKTKHMITMAEDVMSERGPQLLSFSSDKDEIIIGMADIIFPSALFVSVFLEEGAIVAAMTSIASIIGLMVLFKGPMEEGMPAIPFVSLGIVGYLVGLALI